eukprot:11225460-Lingulodinium_polyedra.AAC.1
MRPPPRVVDTLHAQPRKGSGAPSCVHRQGAGQTASSAPAWCRAQRQPAPAATPVTPPNWARSGAGADDA